MVQEQINAPGGKNNSIDEGIEAAQAQINAPAIDALLEQIDTVMELMRKLLSKVLCKKVGNKWCSRKKEFSVLKMNMA